MVIAEGRGKGVTDREIRVTLLDAAELPERLPEGISSLDGKLYLSRGEKAFRCEDTPEARELMAALAGEARIAKPGTAEDTLRRILSGKLKENIPGILKSFRIRTAGPCCVIALTCGNRNGLDLCETIRNVAPTEKGDLLISFSTEMTVLIKQGDDLAETTEFALALLDTVEGETGLRLQAGIGEPHPGPEEWAEGFREACEALQTGREFHLKGTVQVYRNQLLERLLGEIPPEKRKAYRQIIFNPRTKKTLNAETLETVEMFFDSDLNLSDTARQMFIHRNTLTYRLDKIRKETGLDLRRFSDSVVFRVLTALPEEDA